MADTRLSIVVDAQDKASSTLQKISGKIEGMKPTFKAMAVAGTAAFAAISGVAITSLKAYADAEKQMTVANAALSNSLKEMSTGALAKLTKEVGNGKGALAGLQEQMNTTSKAAIKLGFDDEDASVAFAKLFQVTGSVTQAQKDLKLAMDLSAFSGRSLEESAAAVTKVHAGGTRILKDFGIEVAEGTTAIEALDLAERKVGGTAESVSKTLEGQMKVISIQFGNIKESIGAALAPALQMLLEKVAPLIERFTEWAEKNPELLSKIILIGGAVAGLVAVVGTLGLALPGIIAGFGLVTAALNPPLVAMLALAAAIAAVNSAYKQLQEQQQALQSSAATNAQLNEKLAGVISKTTDPARKAQLQAQYASTQESIAETKAIADQGFFKSVATGWRNILGFDTGGMVPGPEGKPQLAVVHGGEYVNTSQEVRAMRRGGGGGSVYNFIFNEVVAGDDGIKRIIKETIGSLNRNSTLRGVAGQ